jgi:cytidylate kinase
MRESRADDPTPEHLAVEMHAIHARDRKDSGRDLSPLKKAEGAVEIDTTDLAFEEQVSRIVDLVRGLPPPVDPKKQPV